MRKKIIIGNWKMNLTDTETRSLLIGLKENIETDKVDVMVCPSFISLLTAKNILEDDDILVGAQNVFYAEAGAYTGEVSVNMLENISINACIVGHSERRKYFSETDQDINKKTAILLEHNIVPILCVGENIEARDNNTYMEIVESQIRKDLDNIDIRKLKDVIIAYEPIWAIGTGKTATKTEAEDMCSFIRYIVATIYGKEVSEDVRIVYGGSANESIAEEFLDCKDIDGLLVGTASLKPEFVNMVKIAEKKVKEKVL